MHSLVYRLLAAEREPYDLARYRMDDGALLALFRRGRAIWIAKIAQGPAGIQRLRAEAAALGWLRSMVTELGVPERLAWCEADEDVAGAACLVQSPIAGRPGRAAWQWSPRAAWAPLPSLTRSAGAWLRRLQRLAPVPSGRNLPDLAGATLQTAERFARQDGTLAPLVHQLLPVLVPLSSRMTSWPPAVAVHGDFWAGNVLVTGGRRPALAGVVDWSGFGAGSALEDILTWMAQLELPFGPYSASSLQRWIAIFFTPGAAREYLRSFSLEAGYSESSARLSFYGFVLRRMLWELGFGLQSRSTGERDEARLFWVELLAWLAAHRYPDPFTPLPLPLDRRHHAAGSPACPRR